MQQILILGSGFAGLAEHRRLPGRSTSAASRRTLVRVAPVNRDDWHSIRVRNYERDLADVGVPWPGGADRGRPRDRHGRRE